MADNDKEVRITGENILVSTDTGNKKLEDSKKDLSEAKTNVDSGSNNGFNEMIEAMKATNDMLAADRKEEEQLAQITSALKNQQELMTEDQINALKGMRNDFKSGKLQTLEEKKEAQKQAQQMLDVLESIEKNTKKDHEFSLGESILGAPVLIVAAIAGLISGIVSGLKWSVGKWWKLLKASGGFILKGLRAILKIFTFGLSEVVGKKFVEAMKSFKTSATKWLKPVTDFFAKMQRWFNVAVKQFKAGLQGAKTTRDTLGRFAKTSKTFFGSIGGFFARFLKVAKDLKTTIAQPFKMLGQAVKDVRAAFTALIKPFSGLAGKSGFFSKLGGALKTFFGKIGPISKQVFGAFKVMGVWIGRLLWPIQVIMGAVAFIKGFIKGFQESSRGNWWEKGLDGLFEGFKSLVNFIIMWPLDMLKDGIGWILGKLGFDNAKEALASFSFQDIYSKLVDGLKDMFWGMVDWFKLLFSDPGAAFESLKSGIGNIGQKIKELIKSLLRSVLPDPDGEREGVGGWAKWLASRAIPSGVYEFAGLDPDTGDPIPVDPAIAGGAGNPSGLELETEQDKLNGSKKEGGGDANINVKQGDNINQSKQDITILNSPSDQLTDNNLALGST